MSPPGALSYFLPKNALTSCMANTQVVAYKPGKQLQPFVEIYWEGNFNDYARDILSVHIVPNGFVELIIHKTTLHCDLEYQKGWAQSPNYTIIGLHTKPYEVKFSSNVKVFGIRFKPEGVYNIFGIPASEFMGNYEDMSMVLGHDFDLFCDQLRDKNTPFERIKLSENYLYNTAQKNKTHLTYVNHAADIIRKTKGLIRIEDVSNQSYISLRQLEREFKNKVGISPKHYLRIARMNEVQRLLENNRKLNLTKIAHQSGYTDQAHFIRDFKNITGIKPTIFMKEKSQHIIYIKSVKEVL